MRTRWKPHSRKELTLSPTCNFISLAQICTIRTSEVANSSVLYWQDQKQVRV